MLIFPLWSSVWASFNEMEISKEEQTGDNGAQRRDEATKATHHHEVPSVLFSADPGGSTAQRMFDEPWPFLLVDETLNTTVL